MSGNDHYDAVIIGCGMSGLAAGIRLALFDKKVLIVERHNAPGGLNSFYFKDGRKFDVGLHAVTNYAPENARRAPQTKLSRQLRIPRESFKLCPQVGSRIAFPDINLHFTNDFSVLEGEIAEAFPNQIDGFRKLALKLKEANPYTLEDESLSARTVIGEYINDPLLTDMLLCPLMFYGSAREDDMDFGQFIILFRALYEEGFARPYEGVRLIIKLLLDQFRNLGGKRKMKCGVRRICERNDKVDTLELDDGSTLTADHVISSIGWAETERLCGRKVDPEIIGRLSFVETISVMRHQPREYSWNDTIVFFNNNERFNYSQPEEPVDVRSGVICFPNNYQYGCEGDLPEGVFRITAMARYDAWKNYSEKDYLEAKEEWFPKVVKSALRHLHPLQDTTINQETLYRDMFTPKTIEFYTGHFGGAVYGSPRKIKDGRTHMGNLYVCGTDQGFLGIIGAMLSGISMANAHILQKSQ